MRFLATLLFSAALALPVLAQPGRGGPGGFGGRPGEGPGPGRPGEGPNQQAEIEKLKQLVRELEAKLDKSRAPDKKPEPPKKEEFKKPEPKKEEARKPEGDRKPEPKKEEARRPEPREQGFRGPQGGPPMGGGFGGRGGEGGGFQRGPGGPGGPGGFQRPMGPQAGGPGFNFPGLNNLTPEEQATFKKLVAKMQQPQQREPDRKQPEGRTTSNSLEARLDRLEKMVQELARSQQRR